MGKRSADRTEEIDQDPPQNSTDSQRSAHSIFTNELIRSNSNTEYQSFGDQAVLLVGIDGSVAEVLQAPDGMAARSPDEFAGVAVDEVWPGKPDDRIVAQVRKAIRSRQVCSVEYPTGDGETHHDFVVVPQGRERAMVVARDISARKNAYTQMERLAYIDDGTNLPNRLFLLKELARCTELLKLREGRAAVLCIDIASQNGQHAVRNSKQHESILVELASRLTHELRGANAEEVDDYERYSVAARIDHNQFGVVLPVIDSGADAEGVTRRLIEVLQQPIRMPHYETRMTARVGIALFPQDGSDADTLYGNAFAAMEDARANAKTPYKLHSGTVRLRALQRQDLELELRAALDNDEFDVEFLPIVSAGDLKTLAVEALLRWPQSMFQQQSIRKVVAIAENTGLILPIGDWVLQKSCDALKDWHGHGWPELKISMNMSVQEFSRDDLADRIAKVLGDAGLEPRFLEIEISEYTLFRDAMKNYANCNALKALGVGIVVDDYGTGACSLAHVARSPVDAIKIDNSFVANAVVDEHDRAACAAITSMAQTLGIRIIAEGVETQEQADMLRDQGCDALQGFLVCRPTSADGIRSFLEQGTGA